MKQGLDNGREAQIKVWSTFSKVVGSRGKAPGRAPQSAKLFRPRRKKSIVNLQARRGLSAFAANGGKQRLQAPGFQFTVSGLSLSCATFEAHNSHNRCMFYEYWRGIMTAQMM